MKILNKLLISLRSTNFLKFIYPSSTLDQVCAVVVFIQNTHFLLSFLFEFRYFRVALSAVVSLYAGTPAARMKKVPNTIVKRRSHELTFVFESFPQYQGMEGQIESIWKTEIVADGIHLIRKGS